jgi:hypothetical protein
MDKLTDTGSGTETTTKKNAKKGTSLRAASGNQRSRAPRRPCSACLGVPGGCPQHAAARAKKRERERLMGPIRLAKQAAKALNRAEQAEAGNSWNLFAATESKDEAAAAEAADGLKKVQACLPQLEATALELETKAAPFRAAVNALNHK